MDESAARIERIKAILGLEQDKDLAGVCETQHPRIHAWKTKGFHKSTGRLIDALLDQYEKDVKKGKGKH